MVSPQSHKIPDHPEVPVWTVNSAPTRAVLCVVPTDPCQRSLVNIKNWWTRVSVHCPGSDAHPGNEELSTAANTALGPVALGSALIQPFLPSLISPKSPGGKKIPCFALLNKVVALSSPTTATCSSCNLGPGKTFTCAQSPETTVNPGR